MENLETPFDADKQLIIAEVRRFVDREVIPVAHQLEHDDNYPIELIEKLKQLGIFSATIPEAYGGLGFDFTTYVQVVEELSRGWMSLAGIVNTHVLVAYMIAAQGTEEQRQRFLPLLAEGDKRGGLCISEANAGSDVQAITMTAVRDGEDYIINGAKLWVTNGVHAGIFAVLVRTDPNAQPAHRGMSVFLVEKGTPGLTVSRTFEKLGYKGVETAELVFDAVRVPAVQLLGGSEGAGFKHAMSGLEVGRINVAARAVGLAQAAFNDAIRYAQQRATFGKPIAQHQAIQLKLADMATKIEAARLLLQKAARKKDRGERCDLEAGMAKLFASEMCQEVTLDALRIHGGFGYTKEFNVERYYRDAPFMLVGEGTSEIQRLVIARQLLEQYKI
ncbi:MAG TPA: acyl-CoA dehydrogenase [Ktedonobacter sp.]|jgi:alkylation response protein AidB-like acyl-CoA dehydrogenase|nr:acyl-CoA dehydrogenase [Ktedonobacter sp.]HAH01351.1 acyl-CoA dehydrogenase [Ktedonobacter sp.]HCF87830.1 acyl-CoA dehydrogenase [Ktedonobacter sp.]HCJ36066.1 acyl-CoA dehydrogenase [Ktedonobacter sp.]HCP75082.1 acyl-CoA dehydrogenase [Ktedonobacter sp.]